MHVLSSTRLSGILTSLEQVLGPYSMASLPLDSQSVVDSSLVDSVLAMTLIHDRLIVQSSKLKQVRFYV